MALPDEHQERLDEGEFHAIAARLDVWEQWPLHRMEFVNGYGADVGNLLAEVERSWAELVVVSERLEQAQVERERAERVIERFYVEAINGVVCTPPGEWTDIEAPVRRDYCRSCKSIWQAVRRILDARQERGAALSEGTGEQETR